MSPPRRNYVNFCRNRKESSERVETARLNTRLASFKVETGKNPQRGLKLRTPGSCARANLCRNRKESSERVETSRCTWRSLIIPLTCRNRKESSERVETPVHTIVLLKRRYVETGKNPQRGLKRRSQISWHLTYCTVRRNRKESSERVETMLNHNGQMSFRVETGKNPQRGLKRR